jgi:tRNA A-37 threonylcarbamoyl transferase component Bud32
VAGDEPLDPVVAVAEAFFLKIQIKKISRSNFNYLIDRVVIIKERLRRRYRSLSMGNAIKQKRPKRFVTLTLTHVQIFTSCSVSCC